MVLRSGVLRVAVRHSVTGRSLLMDSGLCGARGLNAVAVVVPESRSPSVTATIHSNRTLHTYTYTHHKDWSSANRLNINLSKTKEMVIFRPVSRVKHIPPREITGIERVHSAKLLGICFSDNLSFAAHIDNTLFAVSQRFYSLKQLKIRGLNQAALDIVFQSLILNKITYAVQSYSGYLLEQQTDRLQAVLNKAKKWGLVSVLYNLREILENQDYRLFNQIVTDPQHCLNSILPPIRTCVFDTRDRGHPHELLCCKYNAYKQSFLNRCLFRYM